MLLDLIIGLVILGVVLYLIGLIPMEQTIRTIVRVLVVAVALVWLLRTAGFTGLG